MALGMVVAATLGAIIAAGGVALAALCARRRRTRQPLKHPPGDMLELSDGGRRYVVAYTIKPSPDLKTPDPQPDILHASGIIIDTVNLDANNLIVVEIYFFVILITNNVYPDGDSQNVTQGADETEEWPSIKEVKGKANEINFKNIQTNSL